jgi:sugar/nucleoside kinase (ribokinase family)
MTPPRVLFVGRATLDVTYSLDQFPVEDTKVFARAMRVAPGGPATNAAITHALLGGKAMLLTALGGGPWAAPVRDELTKLRIDLIDLAAGSNYEMPLTTVLVSESGATRTIVNPPQSDVKLMRAETWQPAWGEMPRLVLTDGFHLNETLPLLRACRAGGAQICLDGGSWKAGTEELASQLSMAICSERFRVPGRGDDDDATIEWLVGIGVPHVAITRGAKPIVGWTRGRKLAIDIAKINPVDTLGAGDVLHGAFCYQFAKTGEFEGALRLAAQIATRSCCGLGIRGWVESE